MFCRGCFPAAVVISGQLSGHQDEDGTISTGKVVAHISVPFRASTSDLYRQLPGWKMKIAKQHARS